MYLPKIQPISFTITNLLKFFSFLSPFLITFFMIMTSVFNNKIVKGLIFTIGLVITTFINYLLKNTLKEKQREDASPLCNVIPFPFKVSGIDANGNGNGIIYSSPGLSSTLLGYTAGYLIFPMKINNQINPSLLVFLIALLGINATVEVYDKCTSIGGVLLGTVLGIILGILYYGVISINGYRDLAYFSEVSSNRTICNKPTKQKFKCTTYKRGERVN